MLIPACKLLEKKNDIFPTHRCGFNLGDKVFTNLQRALREQSHFAGARQLSSHASDSSNTGPEGTRGEAALLLGNFSPFSFEQVTGTLLVIAVSLKNMTSVSPRNVKKTSKKAGIFHWILDKYILEGTRMQPSNFSVGLSFSWVPRPVCCASGKPQAEPKGRAEKHGRGRTGALDARPTLV